MRKKITSFILALALVLTMIPVNAFAAGLPADGVVKDGEWYNYRNNQENNGVTNRPTPVDKSETWMKYATLNGGTGFDASPTPPLILDGYLYTGIGNKIYKLDKETGKQVAVSEPMVGDVGYAMNPITYADGKLFVQVGKGVVQAMDYKTLKRLWHTPVVESSAQTVSTIAYTRVNGKGYIYTGTWSAEQKNGAYFCVSTDNSNVKNNVKQFTWTFTPKEDDPVLKADSTMGPRGFYWAGAYANENYIAFGSDDGAGDNYFESTGEKSAVFYTLNPTTGKIIDRIDKIYGDIRCNVAFDNGYLYFTTKTGRLYKVKVDKNGKMDHSSIDYVDLGGKTTGTPVIYKNKIYLGVMGKGGQFEAGGGHTFAVVSNEGKLRKLYDIPIAGYPQAGALLSTAHENDDFDGDGRPDGRVYLYFTYNSGEGGIYYTYDTPNGKNLPKETGKIFVPAPKYQEHCISPIAVDRDGTLYYKNDASYIFAVEINSAYIDDINITFNGNKQKVTPEVNPQVKNYSVVTPSTGKATLNLQLSKGAKATINGKPYNGNFQFNVEKGGTDLAIVVKKGVESREYIIHARTENENASIGEFYVNNSNNPTGGVKADSTPKLTDDNFDYTFDLIKVDPIKGHQAEFYNLWIKPSEPTSKISVKAVDNVVDIKSANNGRYAIYFGNSDKSARVNVEVLAESGLKNTYHIHLKRVADNMQPDDYNPTTPELAPAGKWDKVNGHDVYKLADGSLAKNKFYTIGVFNYYLEDNGYMATGWRTIGNYDYYFHLKGGNAMKAWQWLEHPNYKDSKWFVFDDETCAKKIGWQTVNGFKYYLGDDGAMLTGWQDINGERYFFHENKAIPKRSGGNAVKGWQRIEGKSYYFYEDGHLARNERTPDGFYVDENGVWKK